jgi:hypothetical protein
MDEIDRSEINRNEQKAAARRRGNFLTGILIVLAVFILAVAISAYVTLRRQQGADFGRSFRDRIESMSKLASQSTEEAYRKLANVKDRVSNLESSRQVEGTQIGQLKQDVQQVRDAEHQQSEELAQIRRQMEADRFDENQQFAALMREQNRDRPNYDTLSSQVTVRKIPFEATKDNGRDVGDGISVNIESIDPEYHRVSGWIWIASDRRTIWLRDQDAQKPVIFYGNKDGEKRELVFTNIAANFVTGYLLVPTQAPPSAENGPAGQ